MEINLDNETKQKNTQLNKDKNIDEYNKFYKKEHYHVSLVNIDSSFRNKSPKNIYTSTVNYLPNDPLSFTQNSSIITINYPNHGFSVDDRIIIQNVTGLNYVLSGNIYLFQHFPYCFIYAPNNNITTNYTTLLNKIQIEISIVNSSTMENILYYDNIPLNALIGIFNINLPSVVNKTTEISSDILTFFGKNSVSELDANYILIQLPFPYYSINQPSYEITDFLKIQFYSINGIPISGINSNYPINYQRLQGFQTIASVKDNNTFNINTNYNALTTGIGGGSKIQIMYISSTEDGFPDANSYNIRFKKNFNNVVRIELVSTEFPFIDYLVKSNGPNQNNMIYWQQIDDGNTIYSTSIPEGNYDGTTLLNVLSQNMNTIQRVTSTNEVPQFNIFNISYNSYTQKINFNGYEITSLPNSLQVDIITIHSVQYFRLTINHPNNLINVNDTIKISNASAIGIVPATSINITFTVYQVNKNSNSYSVLLGTIKQLSATSDLGTTLIDNGGGTTTIQTKSLFRLLFNYPNTIGNVLGFKNTGQPNAITPYNNVISNFGYYTLDTNLNTVGNVTTNHLLLNLTGVNNYYLLYINDYELVYNNSSELPSFAKILLSGSPGDVLYNTFINYPLEFDFPVSTLNEIKIKITYGDGTLPDFRNIDHSFTLKITEFINYPRNTGINSKNTNFIETLKTLDV